MEWRENPALADHLLSLIAEDMKLNKPLPHVTELIYCLTRSWMDRFEPLPLTAKETCLFSIGVGLGDVLLVPHRQEVSGKLEGIHYSIDFMTTSEGQMGPPGELKSTRISIKKDPADFSSGWKKQLLAYMKTANSLTATYAIMYVIPAMFKAWEVAATQEEVDANWTWLQARKVQYMDFIGRREKPTPFKYNEDWECKSPCRYLLVCQGSPIEARQKEDNNE